MKTSVKSWKSLNENLSIKDGIYDGNFKGYVVTIPSLNYNFKCTSGYKNIYPFPCTVKIINGSAIVYSKGGLNFSDKEIEDKYHDEYGIGYEARLKDPLFKQYKKQENNKMITNTIKWKKINENESEDEYNYHGHLSQQIMDAILNIMEKAGKLTSEQYIEVYSEVVQSLNHTIEEFKK